MDLKNIKYAIGKNFSIKGKECNGGSKTLEGYCPIFNATVVEKLETRGAKLISQGTISEFEINNEFVSETAHEVANKNVSIGIGTDFNGSLRMSANALEIIGYKPTYGLISRFGLYAVACAFDTVGIYGTTVSEIALIANELKGLDDNDMNTWDSSNIDLLEKINDKADKKLFYIKELATPKFFETLKNLQITADEVAVDINLINSIKLIHNCILSAETTTTLSNLTGIPFGNSKKGKDADEIMLNFRSQLGSDIKEKLVVGTYSLSKENLNKFYYNSLRIRRLLVDELNKLFEKYDGLITPVEESSLLIANLGGYPSIAVKDIIITGKQKDDANILNIANILSKDGE